MLDISSGAIYSESMSRRGGHVTIGSAEYYNRLSRAGVRINPGGTATRVVRDSGGFTHEEDLGKVKPTLRPDSQTGAINVPALETETGKVVVSPSGPGSVGKLSSETEKER